MIGTFRDFVVKYTRGELYRFIKKLEDEGEKFIDTNNKKKIKDYLYIKDAGDSVIKNFEEIWKEYKIF